MTTTPADEMRSAAATLRKRAEAATAGPWTWTRWHSDDCPANCDAPSCFLLIVGSAHGMVGDADVDRPDVFAVERSVYERGEGDAAYIATMDPIVGCALADLLETEAAVADDVHRGSPALTAAELEAIVGGPLAVARALNGARS